MAVFLFRTSLILLLPTCNPKIEKYFFCLLYLYFYDKNYFKNDAPNFRLSPCVFIDGKCVFARFVSEKR
jgi:hypothetical protein